MLDWNQLLTYFIFFLFAISLVMFFINRQGKYATNSSFYLLYTVVCWLLVASMLRGFFIDIDYLSLGFGVWGAYAGYKSFRRYQSFKKVKKPKKSKKKPNIKLVN